MFQSYSSTTSPDTVAARVADLRKALSDAGFTGMLVPRADAHQGEYVAPRDQRLAWLTSFRNGRAVCRWALHHSRG